MVARIARNIGLAGFVRNDAEGVVIGLATDESGCSEFISALLSALPRLARVESIERTPADVAAETFRIVSSVSGRPLTEITPDAAVCPACAAEVFDATSRRYRYPLTTCTDCGPRYSITTAIPFDRENTTLRDYPLCDACRLEYEDEADRRYHAQALACPLCGPRVYLEHGGARVGRRVETDDPVAAAAERLREGDIVAVKGVGGYQLCCDATSSASVAELRRRKRRPHRAFALMVRDLAVAARLVKMSDADRALLRGPAAPIVLLERRQPLDQARVADEVAPDQPRLGLMLPTSPLHALLLGDLDRPIVCTSGNVTSEPQCIDDAEARRRLSPIADWLLVHERPIHSRLDDSVVAVMAGEHRVLRRARGYAPEAIRLPPGLDKAPPIVALGADLKATFALTMEGRAILSPHLGDLGELSTYQAYESALLLLSRLHEHRPEVVAFDAHPAYASHSMARDLAFASGLKEVQVDHHHAHVAACLVDNGWPSSAGSVLGLALDGLGAGPGGELRGGELLLCDYARYEHLATFEAVPLLGGDAASSMPWRSLYAHLRASMSWAQLEADYRDSEPIAYLAKRRSTLVEQVLANPRLSPPASSAGRLFDAVAAALGSRRDLTEYEGQAAMQLEALVTKPALREARLRAYAPALGPWRDGRPTEIRTSSIWPALLRDLADGVDRAIVAARFHVGLAQSLSHLLREARDRTGIGTVALSGGCFQNRVLVEELAAELRDGGFELLLHHRVPPNDGGISLGQAAVAAARES